jgi:transcriptional regulator of arginine metabolism
MKNKERRVKLIKKIIAHQEISTQKELVRALRKNGVVASQATVSRDIKEIPLVKIRTNQGRLAYCLGVNLTSIANQRLEQHLDEFATSLARSRNLLVLKTTPGSAQTLASSLDKAELDGVLGTVAGDDTIIIVLSSDRKAEQLSNWLVKTISKG